MRSIKDISGPWIEVNLSALNHNIEQIAKYCGRPLLPVIKANAYGHGLMEVGHRLEKLKAVHGLCVGVITEALSLREAGVKCPVLNLGPYTPKEAGSVVAQGISQSVFNKNINWLNHAAKSQGRMALVHIKIDTGLGRVGAPFDQAAEFIKYVAGLEHVRIEGVFTSLSEDKEHDLIQVERLKRIKAVAEAQGISPGLIHAASSDALLETPETWLDMVRPGIMVFGHYPSKAEYDSRRIDLRPALTLKARVTNKRLLKKGQSVAYHQAYTADRDQLMATGGIGYPDGYPVTLAGKAECLIRGGRHPLIAAVTANHVYIRLNGDDVELGDEIVLIGKQGREEISVEEISALAERSEYQVLARLSPVLPRFYSEG